MPDLSLAGTAGAPCDLTIDLVAPSAVAASWGAAEAGGVALPFQTTGWVDAHLAAHPNGVEAVVLRGRRGGGDVFFLPLEVTRVGPLRVARRLSGSHAPYVFPVLAEPVEAIDGAALAAALRAAGRAAGIDLFRFEAMPLVWDGRANPLAALPRRASLDDAHALALPPSFEELLAARNAGHKRKKIRAKEKLLVAAGDYRISTAATVADVEATLAAFFAQKAASLAARGIADPFADQGVRAFFRRLAVGSLGNPEPLLELTRLEAGGAIRAVIGASIRDRRLFALFASHAHDDLSRASPGETLFFRHIEAACGRGLAAYDMGVGSERYKASWCDTRIPLVDVSLAVTPAGRLLGAAGDALGALKARLRRDERLWGAVKRLRARIAGRPSEPAEGE